MTDLLAGRIHLLFLPLGSALPQIEAGKLRAIGVTTPNRDENAPAIPAIGEQLPEYSLSSWQALMVTGGTPSDIVDQLNSVVQEIISRPDVLARFRKLHLSRRAPASAEANKAFILSEFNKWKGVLQDVGLAKQQ
jgi:tripartite-type tricarboxylate transporter receptor subunit TctC